MDIGFGVFWWLNLNNQVDILNIQSSWGDICGNQNLEFSFFESFHGYFSLILCNISMHNLDVLLDFVWEDQLVGIVFGLSENNGFSISSVADQDVSQSRHSILIWAVNGQMVHFFRGFIF